MLEKDTFVVHQACPKAPNDFDFAIGNWKVSHRKLKDVFAVEEQWVEFEGESSTTKILGGFGNLEDNILHLPDTSFRAVALRSYDQYTKKWSIWWLDGRFPDQIDVPVVGEFNDRIGEFYAEEVLNGKSTKIRFIWDTREPQKPKWEQAFSVDGGVTWKTNWTMIFLPAL